MALVLVLMVLLPGVGARAEEAPAWVTAADKQNPMTADETRAFMKRLAKFVEENHLKKNENTPQRGMIYEYFDVRRKGQFDQFVQGEALDTMHDGAWFGAALVVAYRATGDEYYRELLVRWVIPFYCRMLNHSDELFAADRDDADAKANRFTGENAHTPGEKGFVPYWWDDGASVSLERRQKKQKLGIFSCVDNLWQKDNQMFLLDGYSRGSSNHMAQDLGVFVQQAWLLMKDGKDETSRKLAGELAEAAKNLAENRRRHHGRIPMCESPTALANGDAAAMKSLADPDDQRLFTPDNHYTRALRDFKPGQRMSVPGFADDQEYRYYSGIARAGGDLPRPLALRLIYDAYTQPMLYRIYSDDAPVPPGINVFDLHPYYFRDGKPEDYRSDRKGPNKKPRPIGSRFGPQNMAVSGIALQAIKKWPGIWEQNRAINAAFDVQIFDRIPKPEDGATIFSAGASRVWFGAEGTVWFSCTRESLRVSGLFSVESLQVRIFSRAKGDGESITINLSKTAGISIMDKQGQELKVKGKVKQSETNPKSFSYSVTLPFTSTIAAAPWMNGVELGRYSLRWSERKPVDFVLSSAQEQVKEHLERELAGGLRTWEAIFNEMGYIPSGIGTGQDFDHFSDSGGYAHLLHAAAEWLMVLEGKNDWEMNQFPKPR
jgi:hypothetical protein